MQGFGLALVASYRPLYDWCSASLLLAPIVFAGFKGVAGSQKLEAAERLRTWAEYLIIPARGQAP